MPSFITTPTTTVYPAGAVAYWSLDNTSWLDSTGNGYTLTAFGGVTNGSGIINQSAVFDGTDRLGTTDVGVPSNSDFSVSVWMSQTVNDGSGCHGLGALFETNFFFQYQANGYWQAGNPFAGQMIQDSTPIPLDGSWRHYVYVYKNGIGSYLYTNGTLVGTAGTSSMGGSVFSIGGGEYNQYYFKGKMDEVGIWNRALTPTEVSSLYNKGHGFAYGSTINNQTNPQIITTKSQYADLLAYWNMNETSGTRYDSSGNNNNLTDVSGTTTYGPGIIGNAARFDGSGTHRLINNNIQAKGAWSISTWFYVNSDTQGGEYPSIWNTGLTGGTYIADVLGDHDSNNGWIYDVSVPQNYGQFQNPGEGIWNHSVVTNDPINGISWYLNGSPVVTNQYGGYNRDWSGITVGTQNSNGSFPNAEGDCYIDEMSIWRRALTSDEITALYNSRNALALSAITFNNTTGNSNALIINNNYQLSKAPILWLASDSNVYTTTGSTVTAWGDKSGNGYNAVLGSYNGPTVLSSPLVNGYSIIDFNSQQLISTVPNDFGATGFTAFFVFIPNTDTTFNFLAGKNYHETSFGFVYTPDNNIGTGISNVASFQAQGYSIPYNNPTILTNGWYNNNGYVRVNGVDAGPVNNGMTTYSEYQNEIGIGTSIDNTGGHSQILEIIIFNSLLRSVDVAYVENMLKTKYNL